MVQYITAIWVGAGCASVAGTLWLMVASKLGKRPFRRSDLIPAKLSEGEFWFDVPGGVVHGTGTVDEAMRFLKELRK